MSDCECIKTRLVEETVEARLVEETIQAILLEEAIYCSVDCWPGGSGGAPSECGQLFATDITGAGIVSDKEYATGTVPVEAVIVKATTDNDSVTIHFMAEGGLNYSPVVTVDNIECTNLEQFPEDRRLFFGSVTVNVTETRTVALGSSTGSTGSVLIERAAGGPTILSVNFVGGYPGSQTEVKEGDSFEIEVHFDPAGSVPSVIRLITYGACLGAVYDIASTELDWLDTHKATITGIIQATGSTAVLLGCRVSSNNAFGTASNTIDSDVSGSVDGFNVVLCNDLIPTFDDNSTTYPAGQNAFKGNESGVQNTTVHNYTSVVYSSPTGEFNVPNGGVYEQEKPIECTSPGSYNDASTNFRIVAQRAQNDTQSTFNKNIEVADIAPVITVTQPQSRLRSSVAGRNYTITASSNQNLSSTPALSIGITVSGTWQGSGWSGGLKVKTRDILIEDSGSKGTGDWFFDGAVPTNRAGIPASITGQENVGGFLERVLTIAAWPNRQALIGTVVTDPSKVVCENLSKGGEAPNGGTIFTYQPTTDNLENRFTILTNDTWYNCDQANAVSNTSGTAQVIISEIV